ncbi:MAG: hypothetical protein ACRD2A_18200, partial [Vicinamibacterales bacterium]
AIVDPTTGLPFANNTIPADRIDPIAEIMALVPVPNATTGNNNFIRQPNVEDNGERYLVRTHLGTWAFSSLASRTLRQWPAASLASISPDISAWGRRTSCRNTNTRTRSST